MTARKRLVVVAGMLAISPAWLSAQTDLPPVPPGTRVRLSTIAAPEFVLTGTVDSWDGRSLGLSRPEEPTLDIPLPNLAKLQISRGEKGNWGLGGAIGAGVGLLAGVIVASVGGPENDEWHLGDAGIVVGSTAAGWALGAITGAIFLRREAWEDVPLP